METNNETWKRFNNSLDLLPADRELKFTGLYPFTHAMVSPLNKNTEMMNIRVEMIKKLCKTDPSSIIEFGGAYGNLGATYLETHLSLDYTLVDTKSMLKFAKVFFDVKGKKANFVPPEEIETAVKDYDLFCTYAAISETPDEYREKVFDLFLPRCKSALIVETPVRSTHPGINCLEEYEKVLEKHYGSYKILDSPPGHSNKNMILYASR